MIKRLSTEYFSNVMRCNILNTVAYAGLFSDISGYPADICHPIKIQVYIPAVIRTSVLACCICSNIC